MKKIITFLLLISVCMLMVACGNKQEENMNTSNNKTDQNKQIESEESKIDNTSEIPTEEQSTTEATDSKKTSNDKTDQNKQIESEESKIDNTAEKPTEEQSNTEAADTSSIIVVYFSNTGNTKAIAEKIANGVSADIFEIVPEDPYTEADLDYGDDKSRSTIEMNDPSVRPVIADDVENIEKYDTIYIGYPIWWGEAPRILDTFVEKYDFSGKTVIPFCTSGGSSIGSSAKTLEELAGSGDWMSGKKFTGSESDKEVMEWVNGL